MSFYCTDCKEDVKVKQKTDENGTYPICSKCQSVCVWPLFGGLLLLLSLPFWCLVILWQDKWDYLDAIHEYLKKRNGGEGMETEFALFNCLDTFFKENF